MLKWMRERLSRDEGFTLIELMVVVLIIAVLVAIAIPSFLGFRDRANDRSAQSEVRSAILAEKGYFTDEEEYTNDITSLTNFVPTLNVVNGALDADNVYVELDAANRVCLHRESKSGTVFSAKLENDSPTVYANSASGTTTTCDGGTWNADPTVGW